MSKQVFKCLHSKRHDYRLTYIYILRVEAYLKPLAIATNILQAPRARLDHALLTLANLYRIYDSDTVEADVRERMLSRVELRWKKGAGKDQDLFILAAFFNPFIRGYCFDREALPPSALYDLAEHAFERFYDCRPDAEFADALTQYSQGTGDFTAENMRLAIHEGRVAEGEVRLLLLLSLCSHLYYPVL